MSEKQQTAADPSKPSSEKVKKIAVVAVHGVGDHLPFATARDIGDLLSNLEYDKPSKTPRYVPFTEVTKRINVEPVKVDDKANGFNWNSPELQRNTWGPLDAVARAVLHGNGARHSNDADNPAESLDHLFMKGQLIEYKGERPEDTYQCLRLEGKRPAHSPAQDSAGEMGAELREEGVKLSAPDPKEKIVHIY